MTGRPAPSSSASVTRPAAAGSGQNRALPGIREGTVLGRRGRVNLYNRPMGKTREQGSAAENPARDEVGRLSERLDQREKVILRKDAELARKEAQLADLLRRLAAVVSADNARQVHFDNTRRINDNLRREKESLQKQLAEIAGSRTWRALTAARRLRLRLFGNPGPR